MRTVSRRARAVVWLAVLALVALTRTGATGDEGPGPEAPPAAGPAATGWKLSDVTAYPEAYRRGTRGVLRWSGIRLSGGWHRADVTAVGWGGGGRWVASVDREGILKRWDAQSGKATHTLAAHGKWCDTLRVSEDGKLIVTYGYDGETGNGGLRGILRLRDAETGEVRLEAKGLHLSDVCFSPDGRYVLGASFFDRLLVWETAKTGEARTIPVAVEGGPGPSCVAVAPDGTWAVVGDQTGAAQVLDLATGAVRHRLAGGSDYVLDVDVSPDARWIVTVDQKDGAKVWDAATGALAKALEAKNIGGRWADVSPDSRRVVVGSMSRVAVWDLVTGETVRVANGAGGEGGGYSPDGTRIAVGDGRRVRILDATTLADVTPSPGKSAGVHVSAIGGGGAWVATAPSGGPVQLWDPESEELICTFTTEGGTRSIVASPNGRWIACAGSFGELDVFDVRQQRHLYSLELERDAAGTRAFGEDHALLGFSDDGKVLAAARMDAWGPDAKIGSIDLWTVRTGKLLRSLPGPWGGPPALSPKLGLALDAPSEGKAAIVELKDGKALRTIDGGPPFAFSPQEDWAVVGVPGVLDLPGPGGGFDGSGTVVRYVEGVPGRTIRVRDGAPLQDLEAGPAVLSRFAVSPDGRWIAAQGRSRTGEPGKAGWIGDGEERTLLTAVGPERLWLWESKSGKLVDDISLPAARHGRTDPGDLVLGKDRILLLSDGDLLVYDVAR